MFMMRNSTLSPHLLLLAVCACQSSAQAGVMKWTPKVRRYTDLTGMPNLSDHRDLQLAVVNIVNCEF